MESEKDTEKYLVKQVEAMGGLCRKFTSAGVRGVPDRVCLFPKGITVWIETKSEGDHANSTQLREHERLRARSHFIWVIDTKRLVNKLIRRVQHELSRRA